MLTGPEGTAELVPDHTSNECTCRDDEDWLLVWRMLEACRIAASRFSAVMSRMEKHHARPTFRNERPAWRSPLRGLGGSTCISQPLAIVTIVASDEPKRKLLPTKTQAPKGLRRKGVKR